MTDRPDYLVAARVENLPEPWVRSERRACSRCGAEVWVSLSMTAWADALPIVCLPCVLELAARARTR